MARYEISTPNRTYTIKTSKLYRTNYTLYEIFAGDEKIGGYLDAPDSSTCDMCYAHMRYAQMRYAHHVSRKAHGNE